jgi:hypothetical protein
LKALSNFFRVRLDSITGSFIEALSFIVCLNLCPPFRRSLKRQLGVPRGGVVP